MKQLGIYIVAITILSGCANQGNIAQYEDDGIYTQPAPSKSATPNASDAYYFVDEDGSGQNVRSGEYYGSGDGRSASTDDYVPEAKSLPSESGQAYNNQRYNAPTYSSAYTSNIPVTMRMGYSSFHSPYAGMGMGVGIGVGYGYMGPSWWGAYYDPWNPWSPYYRWNRWNRWNMWYTWNTWTPYGPYGSCFGGYGIGFNNGFYAGVNSYNWGESSNNNTYSGPRPPVGGSFGNTGSNSSGFAPRDNSRFSSNGRDGREGASPSRAGNDARTPDEFRSPNREPSRTTPERRPTNPNVTRTPATSREREPFFRWNNGSNSRTPDSQPSRGYTPPSRGGSSSPSARPSRTPSNNFSRPSTPSRSPSARPSTPSRSPSARPSAPSRSSSPSRSSGGSSRGGRR